MHMISILINRAHKNIHLHFILLYTHLHCIQVRKKGIKKREEKN